MREGALDRPLEVAGDEHGLVRVFAIDGADAKAAPWTDPDAPGWRLPAALGVADLSPRDVQVFTARDLAGMDLPAFLASGYEIGEDQLDPDRATLDRAVAEGEGRLFAVLRSPAFAGRPVTLAPAEGVRLIGLYAEPGATPGLAPMPGIESARPPASGADAALPPEQPEPEAPESEAPEPAMAEEHVLERFRPDREIYIRDHLWMAALGMIAAVAVLYLMGNGTPWVGAPAALLAIGVRGAYLASDELGQRWDLTATEIAHVNVDGQRVRGIPIGGIARVRKLGSGVQVVATGGDKMMLKYLAAPDAAVARLGRAGGVAS